VSMAEVNAAIDRFADSAIADKLRKHSLAPELARLDELHEVFLSTGARGRRPVWRAGCQDHRAPQCDARPSYATDGGIADRRERDAEGNFNRSERACARPRWSETRRRATRPRIDRRTPPPQPWRAGAFSVGANPAVVSSCVGRIPPANFGLSRKAEIRKC
jgi:hypothetical protein